MVEGEAFMFPVGKRGIPITSERPLVIANRLRTRDREICVTEVCLESEAMGCSISIVDGKGDRLPSRIPPETTFYLVASVEPEGRFLNGTEIAHVHPLLTDLGSWTDGPDWRPTWGPRFYPINFRFTTGPCRKRSIRADEIVALAAQGLPDKLIAQRLGIGPRTVETHWRTLRERNGYASRTEAVATYLVALAAREREDVEAQRDRIAAETWLKESAPSRYTSLSGRSRVLSWPMI